jgi:protein arginine N-methyltransferase 1
MEHRNNQRRSQEREKPYVPDRFNIKKADEAGFDIETCMKDFQTPGTTYEKNSDYYFDSYGHFGIHEEMLKDRTRTLAYRNAIMNNAHLFKDKIVLDVGCGTGILSIFAARAGAKHVYGVEFASIAKHAQEIANENGFKDKITIVKGKIEEVTLPVDKVDIIISEWMGYFLLYESMFDSVLFARDKWLTPDGQLFPNRSVLYMAGIEDEEYKNQKVNFWDDVYGVDMSSIKKWVLFEPLVDVVDPELINTEACPIYDIDLKTVKKEDLDFSAEYQLRVRRDDRIHAVIAWFDVFFDYGQGSTPVELSTSPYRKDTHWKQTVFYLNDVLKVKTGDVLSGSIAVKKCIGNPRELDIKLSYHLKNGSQEVNKKQFYRLC